MKSRSSVAKFKALLIIVAMAYVPAALAQTFPSRPITFVIPFVLNPGADPFLRALAREVTKALGQPVTLDYRPGGGGRVGLQAVMNARGDPHTIGYGHTGNLVLQPLITPSMRIEPGKDYVPVATLYETRQALYVSPSAPFNDLKSLIEYARRNPGKLNGGSNGIGGPSHLALELFNTLARTEIVHVPYKGEGESIPALMTNQIQMIITTAGPKSFVDAGRITVLATTGKQRWSVYPDKPTVMEAGLPDFYFTVLVNVVAPPGTPVDAVSKMNSAFNGGLKSPEVLRHLQFVGGDVIIESPNQATSRVRAELDRLAPVVKRSGIVMN